MKRWKSGGQDCILWEKCGAKNEGNTVGRENCQRSPLALLQEFAPASPETRRFFPDQRRKNSSSLRREARI